MGLTGSARGTHNINQDRRIVEMSNKIALLKPRIAPVTVILKRGLGTKQVTKQEKFEWLEDAYMNRWTLGTAIEPDDATVIAVTVGTGVLFAAGDLMKLVRTGEVMKVVSIATDNITVVRGYGSTTAAATESGDYYLIMSNANMQGATVPSEKYRATTDNYNYTQIFRTPYSTTGTLNASELYGGPELQRLRAKKGEEHMRSIEYASLFGERSRVTTGEQPITTTAGIDYFVAIAGGFTDSIDADDAAAEASFETYLRTLFQYGSDEKSLVAGPYMISWINSFAKAKLDVIQSDNDKTYGLHITKYRSPHGMLNLIEHPLLVGGYANYGYGLDFGNLKYRNLKNRDTKLKQNIQDNSADGTQDEYITEAGFEVKLPESHRRLILT